MDVWMLSTYRRAHDNAFHDAAHRTARAMAAAFKQLYVCAAGAGSTGGVLVGSAGNSQVLS